MTQEHPKPVVVAFVSGKGGVGKTMLSVAFAKELSRANKTLLVDLDFFNRGLTGLLLSGRQAGDIEKPDFLAADAPGQHASDPWHLIEVAPDLFHISYPDLTSDEMSRFETLDVNALKESLSRFVAKAIEQCGAAAVVLDCHGGPDHSSFAACLLADYSLLISEPDRITFYGTLNFLRQLDHVRGEAAVDIRLVFNKVIPAFSPFFLRNLYKKRFAELFGGRPLMGLFPLEVYLTKDFEKTPFLTSVYPSSYLNRKTRVMAYDLLSDRHPDLVSPAARSLPRALRWQQRLSLGRPFFLFDINFLMGTLVAVGVVQFALSALPEAGPESALAKSSPVLSALVRFLVPAADFADKFEDEIYILYAVAIGLFFFALYRNWRIWLSRSFTYSVRLNKIFPSLVYWFGIACLWMVPILIAAGVLAAFADEGRTGRIAEAAIMLAYSLLLLPEAYRIYRDLRYEPHFIESSLRLAMIAFAISMPFVVKGMF